MHRSNTILYINKKKIEIAILLGIKRLGEIVWAREFGGDVSSKRMILRGEYVRKET